MSEPLGETERTIPLRPDEVAYLLSDDDRTGRGVRRCTCCDHLAVLHSGDDFDSCLIPGCPCQYNAVYLTCRPAVPEGWKYQHAEHFDTVAEATAAGWVFGLYPRDFARCAEHSEGPPPCSV